MCSSTWETCIPSDMCSPTWKHLSLVIYVPLLVKHITLEICVPPPGKHISLLICVPLPGKHISLVTCVHLPGKHISLVICVPLPGKHISLVTCVHLPGKHISLVICVPSPGKLISLVSPTTLQLLGSILFFFWQKERPKRSWLLWLPWAYKAYHVILSSSMDGIVWPEFIWIWGTTPHVGYACTLPCGLCLYIALRGFYLVICFPPIPRFSDIKMLDRVYGW